MLKDAILAKYKTTKVTIREYRWLFCVEYLNCFRDPNDSLDVPTCKNRFYRYAKTALLAFFLHKNKNSDKIMLR